MRLGFKFGDRFRDPEAHAALALDPERETKKPRSIAAASCVGAVTFI
jgi:hypothetical protein